VNLRAAPLALLGLLVVAACGSTIYYSSPTPTQSLPIPGTVAPTSSLSPTAGGGSPTPFEASGELFFAMFGAVPPPFHVSLATTLSGSPSGVALTEADADGADYTAQLHVEITGVAPQDSQIVVVGGTGYVADVGSADWRAYPDYETIPPVNPFLGLDPSQWSELGADPAHGGLDHLNSTTWRLPPDSSLVDRVEDVNFDLWLDSDGMPVTAELSLTLPALDRTSEVGYSAVYTFSRIGEPVVIVPPA
jgi:hypothetical protein